MVVQIERGRHWRLRWKWDLVTLLGAIAYVILAWHFTHFQDTMMDEGAYLYTGWLFVRGIYQPFQPYGPWVNKMPLVFLLYGGIQRWLGPGLATGRYFSAVVAGVGWAGMWLIVRRLGTRRVAALVIWMALATIALVRIVSWAATEGICSAIMLWALVMMLQERPKNGVLFVSGVLAGLVAVLRINLTLFSITVPFWAWWLYGGRKAKWVGLGVVISLLVGYGLYWPDVLRLWFPWLPMFMQRWLPWYGLDVGKSVSFLTTPARRWGAILDMLRVYPLPWLSLLGSTVVIVRHRQWKEVSDFQRRVLIGLLALLWGLVLTHLWATVGKGGELLFQMSVYWAFFAPLAFIVGALTICWYGNVVGVYERSVFVGLFLIFVGLGMWGGKYLVKRAVVFVVGEMGKGSSMILGNLFPSGPFKNPYLLQGAAMGSVVFLVLTAVGWLILRRSPSVLKAKWQRVSYKAPGLATFLLIFVVLSPLPLWSGSFRPYDCAVDTLSQHHRIGMELTSVLQPKDKVYLEGIEAVTILLYLPFDVQTFPPQYDGIFTYRIGGDPDTVYRLGFWNAALSRQWWRESNVFLISKAAVLENHELQDFLQKHGFREVKVTDPLTPCTQGPVLSRIVVYRRSHNP